MIGMVKQNGSNVEIYDENGNFKCNCGGYGDLKGFSTTLVVRLNGSNVEIYDQNGNFKCTCGGYGEVVAVVGETVIRQNGSNTEVYDANGNFVRTQKSSTFGDKPKPSLSPAVRRRPFRPPPARRGFRVGKPEGGSLSNSFILLIFFPGLFRIPRPVSETGSGAL